MGYAEISKLWIIGVILGVALLYSAEGYREVPCYYIFGDSLADSGNNNNLETVAKADYRPYGIDFPFGPTGRFTNGRNTVDFIAEKLGFPEYIPPYASATFLDILYGVNYASGSSGILNETAQQLGERIPFDMQLENHRNVLMDLSRMTGNEKVAAWYLGKCLYTVGLGNNDYINNYFVTDYYNTSKIYTINQFTELLVHQYTRQFKRLYRYGARKIAIFGLGSIGCTPDAISKYGNGTGCAQSMQEAAILFNSLMVPVVDQLNHNLTDAKFTYINSYEIGKNAADVGFTNVASPCCPVNSGGQCIPNGIPCKNRTAYVFWDAFHPTESLNKDTAERSYQALYPSDVHPYDIRTLLQPRQPLSTL